MNRQTLIEQRIYQLHQRVIDKLKAEPERILALARANLQRYQIQNGDWLAYQYWEKKLALPVSDIITLLSSQHDEAVLARSNSPFAGSLTPQERWAIWKECRNADETS